MCNRYRMTAKVAELAARFGVAAPYPPDLVVPPPELFPKRSAWIVRDADGTRTLDVAVWGFPPPAAAKAPVTNVRNLASPFWRSALGNPQRRCLVPVTDFCEWEGEAGSKAARWFSVPSRPIFAFAGVWRPTEAGKAFAFLTCEPNPLVAAVHPKAMPVILHDEDFDRWLSDDHATACGLAAPYPGQLMAVA
jgi:putative SOS response-associated peptidase YedK